MSYAEVTPEYIRMARALAHWRKRKYTKRRRRTDSWGADSGLKGWRMLGSGYYGEAWAHEDYAGLVVKISGRAGFGTGYMRDARPGMDGWPVFAQFCQYSPHKNLPKVHHFERLSLGASFGIMPEYTSISYDYTVKQERQAREWRRMLDGERTPESWLWPLCQMREGLKVGVDLHMGNVMLDEVSGELIITDPFSEGAESCT